MLADIRIPEARPARSPNAAAALAVLAGILLLALAPPARAQWFGQNKVQYNQFRWSYFRTPHFDIYFPQGGDLIARFAARHVEEMYASVSRTVGHRLTSRVPIILHSSHAEFVQTNVIRLPLHEGIGGFTEIFKNRVVLPFEGSYTDFHHVLQHELVHAVMFDRMFGDNAAAMVARQGGSLPLWVSEGLAEYATLGWDLGSEFFMHGHLALLMAVESPRAGAPLNVGACQSRTRHARPGDAPLHHSRSR